MELDGFIVGQSVLFGQKGSSQGRLAVIVEFLIGEAGQDGRLADSTVPHRDQLDLVDVPRLVLWPRH